MGMESVLQSIKNAEESALAKIAASKDEAAKILADARKEASEIIQDAQDGAVSSTVATLDSARTEAGKEAETVQAEGCLLYTSPSPRDTMSSRMPSSA